MSIVPCIHTYSALQMKNMCPIHNYSAHVYILTANEKHEYRALYIYLMQM